MIYSNIISSCQKDLIIDFSNVRGGVSSMTPAEDIRVLFVRTAFSLSEFKNTLADAARILSYREDPSKYRADALSQCNRLANSLEIDPFGLPVWSAYPANPISANTRIWRSSDGLMECSRREDSKTVFRFF